MRRECSLNELRAMTPRERNAALDALAHPARRGRVRGHRLALAATIVAVLGFMWLAWDLWGAFIRFHASCP